MKNVPFVWYFDFVVARSGCLCVSPCSMTVSATTAWSSQCTCQILEDRPHSARPGQASWHNAKQTGAAHVQAGNYTPASRHVTVTSQSGGGTGAGPALVGRSYVTPPIQCDSWWPGQGCGYQGQGAVSVTPLGQPLHTTHSVHTNRPPPVTQ